MIIKSSTNLRYPIRVTELLVRPGDEVEQSNILFRYTYKSKVVEGRDKQEVERDFPAEFESDTDGNVVEWKISKGETITGPGFELIDIFEPCKHETQFAGMCVICGKDMTKVHWTSKESNASRAPVNMTHGQTALKVSRDEAARTSETSKRLLLGSKKLILVVDLDQTIIHATVDPTVADWQKDESNPNHDAVKDVKSFQLQDEGPSGRICTYYIKMRPGLAEFLEEISKTYELHIYTMGTRSYALNVAKIIDPDQRFFGDRILSRDESGSMTFKNLQRLFPVDQDMVVIIDDRGDVWSWSLNLIRVTPYDFFVGIGDINSSFLPKRADLIKSTKATEAPVVEEVAEAVEATEPVQKAETEPPQPVDATASVEERLVAMAGNDPSLLQKQGQTQQEEIAAQLEERPLLRKQEQLDKQDEESEHNGTQDAAESHRHHLLKDDDRELIDLQANLEKVHQQFYAEYERALAGSQGGRVAQLRGEGLSKKRPTEDLSLVPDIKIILPNMKLEVLSGVKICFTGVIPQGTLHETSDLGFWARTFGALVSPNLTKSTTHVIAHPDRRTSKVRQAAKHPHISIVTTSWLFDCFVKWTHLEEDPYKIDVEPDDRPDEDLPEELDDDVTVQDDTNGLADDEGDDQDGDDDDLEPPISPTSEFLPQNAADWAAMDDEVDEMLNDEDEDSEDDVGGASGSESDASVNSNSSKKSLKRKRTESESGSDNDQPNGTAGLPESHLQKRKKRAMERTTSLTHVANADQSSGLPSPDETGPEEDEIANMVTKKTSEGDDDDGAEDEAQSEDEFEALLEAEFEKDEVENEL